MNKKSFLLFAICTSLLFSLSFISADITTKDVLKEEKDRSPGATIATHEDDDWVILPDHFRRLGFSTENLRLLGEETGKHQLIFPDLYREKVVEGVRKFTMCRFNVKESIIYLESRRDEVAVCTLIEAKEGEWNRIERIIFSESIYGGTVGRVNSQNYFLPSQHSRLNSRIERIKEDFSHYVENIVSMKISSSKTNSTDNQYESDMMIGLRQVLEIHYLNNKGERELIKQPYFLPTGFQVTVRDKLLLIQDKHSGMLRWKGEDVDGLILMPRVSVEDNKEVELEFKFWAINVKEERSSSYEDTVQEALDRVRKYSYLREATQEVLARRDGKNLLGRGPNRDGYVLLNSLTGSSDLLYHPKSKNIIFFSGWQGTPTILENKTDYFTAQGIESRGRGQSTWDITWRIDFAFDNPKGQFRVTEINKTRIK